MRLHAGLPKMFLAEAVNIAAHLINQGPSTPFKYKRSTFLPLQTSSKSKKCYFVGYGDSEFGYLLWDDQNWKIVRSKDVIFNEAIL